MSDLDVNQAKGAVDAETGESNEVPAPQRGRQPRAGELTLMLSLLAGPRKVSSGPIGRCVKRGWCQALLIHSAEGKSDGVRVLYDLTEIGRAVLDEDENRIAASSLADDRRSPDAARMPDSHASGEVKKRPRRRPRPSSPWRERLNRCGRAGSIAPRDL